LRALQAERKMEMHTKSVDQLLYRRARFMFEIPWFGKVWRQEGLQPEEMCGQQ
jgi:hypothetical protein